MNENRLLNGARMLGHLFRTTPSPKCAWGFESCPHRPVPAFCEAKHQWINLARESGRVLHYEHPLVASFTLDEFDAAGITITLEVPDGSPSRGPALVKIGPKGAVTAKGVLKMASEAGLSSTKVFRVLEQFPGARVVGMESPSPGAAPTPPPAVEEAKT